MSDRSLDEVVAAMTRALNFKRDRATMLRGDALRHFKANNAAMAYRCLGQADEIDLIVNEFDQMRVKISLGEPL